MPQTVNGIGTHYYGKKNLEVEMAQCEFCSNVGQLQTYETGLYFVFIYIPLIPLGRKQIIDYCPSCTRHRALPVAEWERLKSQAIESSTTQLSEKMDDPAAAVEHLQTLTAFKQLDEAKELALAIEGTPPHDSDPDVQIFLGAWHEKYGVMTDADRCFDRAFELDPKHTGALRARAVGLMEQGQLDESRAMLAQFELPSEDYDPSLFFMLASHYQKNNRHSEAIELFDKLASDNPELGKSPELRKAVKISEKASGMRSEHVAQPSIFTKGWFWATLAIIGLIVGMFFVASNIGNKRELVVVNGLGQPLIVKIDDLSPVQIQPEKYTRVPGVSEGAHVVEIIEPAQHAGTKNFEFETGLMGRLFNSPVFVLDPTESSIVIWEETVYSETPVDEEKYEFKVGELLTHFPHADYPFQDFPDTLKVDSKTAKLRKSRVDFIPFNPGIFMTGQIDLPIERQMEMTENWLDFNPNEMDRLRMYMVLGAMHGQSVRVEQYLETKLDQRPLLVELHRAYQNEAESHGKDMAELRKRYDDYIVAEPNDPDLVYLRGRLENDKQTSDEFYKKAIEIDANHWHSISAMAYNEMSTMNFEAAAEGFKKANSINPDDEQIKDYYIETLFATKNYSALRSIIKTNPETYSEFQTAANFLMASGQKARVSGLLNSFKSKNADSPTYSTMAELHVNYLNENYGLLKTKSEQLFIPFEKSYFQYIADVELLDHVAADKHLKEFMDEVPDETKELIAVAAKLAGDDDAADKQLTEVLRHMDSEGPTEKQAATIIRLAKNGNVDMDAIRNIMLEPHRKRILAALVKVISNSNDPQLDELIETVNYDLGFPHNMVKRIQTGGTN